MTYEIEVVDARPVPAEMPAMPEGVEGIVRMLVEKAEAEYRTRGGAKVEAGVEIRYEIERKGCADDSLCSLGCDRPSGVSDLFADRSIVLCGTNAFHSSDHRRR